jgi:uncharacterized membrane protein
MPIRKSQLSRLSATKRRPKQLILSIKNSKIMKLRTFIVGLLILSTFLSGRAQDKCPTVVVVRKSLYDSFQNARAGVESLERELIRDRQVLEDLRQKYRDCERQADIAAMLKQAEDAVQAVDAQLKTATEVYRKVELEVR